MSAARRVPSRIGTMTDLSMTISYWGALDMQLLIGTAQSSRKKTAGVRARLLIFRLMQKRKPGPTRTRVCWAFVFLTPSFPRLDGGDCRRRLCHVDQDRLA